MSDTYTSRDTVPRAAGRPDAALGRTQSPMQRRPTMTDRADSGTRAAEHIEEKLPGFLRIPEHKKSKHHHAAFYDTLERRLMIKNEIIAAVAEFVGTVMFLFFAFCIATQATNRGNELEAADPNAPLDLEGLLYSSLGFGFALAVNAWIFFRISGGLMNPAVGFALTLTGTITWTRFFVLTVVQYAGGLTAAALCNALIPGGINARTTLHNDTSVVQGFFLEFLCTAMLIFAIYMLAAEKHRGTFLAPVGIGLTLFIAELLSTNFTGGSLNPARTLGPDVVLRQFDRTCWIYYVSSYAAALVTAGFYMALRASHYTSVVPDQDAEMVQEMKQVVRDVHGNVIGSIDMVPASESAPLLEDQAALAAEEGRVAPGMAEASAGNSDFTYAAKDDATYSHDVLRHKTSSSSTAAPPVAPARAI